MSCPICGVAGAHTCGGFPRESSGGVRIHTITKETAMYRNTTGEAVYLNADRSKTVKENDPEAAFLLVGPNGELPDKEAEKYGLKVRDPESPTRVERLQAAHDAAMARGAHDEASVHRQNLAAAQAEEGAKPKAARANDSGQEDARRAPEPAAESGGAKSEKAKGS